MCSGGSKLEQRKLEYKVHRVPLDHMELLVRNTIVLAFLLQLGITRLFHPAHL